MLPDDAGRKMGLNMRREEEMGCEVGPLPPSLFSETHPHLFPPSQVRLGCVGSGEQVEKMAGG